MADNFLEKKFEEYRRVGIKKMPKPQKVRAVFIADGLSDNGEIEVRKYAAMAGTAVAFAGADRKKGNALAQDTGSRFYLLGAQSLDDAIADARAHWRRLPFEII